MNHIIDRVLTAVALSALLAAPAYAQKAYGPGASDTEIKVVSPSNLFLVENRTAPKRVEIALWLVV